MANANEVKQPLFSTEKITTFLRTSKGTILTAEMALCLLVIVCKASSIKCYLWSAVVELVWAVITFIVYALDLDLALIFFPWTDFFRAITGSLFLFITSLLCMTGSWTEPGLVAGNVFSLLAAVVFGYDTIVTIKDIKNLKQQGVDLGIVVTRF
ncbi:proteolipid protein 2 [Triplophysa rosa]|uniref:Proteolipid protein 2 n=1 Tax=Triplophysa rosa TaxID=992332 RepID=A0A9W7TKT5_TRIRA|nr:proteolipid protein 2 [Triplophysa rosa]KAI7798216.1 hypothetical protein IRJ41_021475 [Triplophysa rosa]